jgi:hypothetical protein
MAPAPKLDYDRTLKRVRTNIRDKRPIQDRDLDILQQGSANTFADIIREIEKTTPVAAKYHSKKRKNDSISAHTPAKKLFGTPAFKTPAPSTDKGKGKTESEHESDDESSEIEWTGREDPRFKLQTKELGMVEENYDSMIPIGIAKHDPEPKRVIAAQFTTYGNLSIEVIDIASDGRQFKPTAKYGTIEFGIKYNADAKFILKIVELRTEIKSGPKLANSIRSFVWDELADRNKKILRMGWSDPNEDVRRYPERAREMRQL